MPEFILPRIREISVLADLSGQSLTGGSDALSSDIEVNFEGWVRVQVVPGADSVWKVKLNGKYGALNQGNALTAGNLWEFDVTVTKGDTINIQTDTDQTVTLLRLLKVVI